MQAVPKCCPSWVCVAPALAIPEACTNMQQMQVFMVPMAAPIMMPMHSGLPNLDSEGYETGAAQFPLFPWSADGQWSYSGDYFNYEEAPQQLLLQTEILHEDSVAQIVQLQSEEKVPSQFDMSMTQTLAQPHEQIGATMSSCTLRRRRHQDSTMEGWWSQAESVPETEEVCAYQEAESEVDLAQELADGLLTQLQAGAAERKAALAHFESLAFKNETTSRAAQIALKDASSLDAAALATGLRGHVRSAVQSKHANFVLQTIIEAMPVARASFIVDELKGSARKIARQQFGCRVLCRILEHLAPNDHSTLELLDEILSEDMSELCRNEFGSYVARHILEHGYPHHKKEVVNVLSADLLMYSKDKFGSHVVETALRHCSQEDQRDLANQLLHSQNDLVVVAGSQFGRHVARALFDMPGEVRKEAVKVLRPVESKLKSLRYGKSVLQSLRREYKQASYA